MPYHKYVFDTENRKFVGHFEEMYQNEDIEGYDSWFEFDLMHDLRKPISYMILNQYAFSKVLDVGCGKGMFTHLLKKRNNRVVGIDCSETAIRKARASFRDIEFRCLGVEDLASMGETFDLVVVMGTFAYVERWPNVLPVISGLTRYFYVAEYIPARPIGFVKSREQLISKVAEHFEIITKVLLDDEHVMLFTESKTHRAGEGNR